MKSKLGCSVSTTSFFWMGWDGMGWDGMGWSAEVIKCFSVGVTMLRNTGGLRTFFRSATEIFSESNFLILSETN